MTVTASVFLCASAALVCAVVFRVVRPAAFRRWPRFSVPFKHAFNHRNQTR